MCDKKKASKSTSLCVCFRIDMKLREINDILLGIKKLPSSASLASAVSTHRTVALRASATINYS